jgi:uncharacterized short protein YbdD (DUF466 family)
MIPDRENSDGAAVPETSAPAAPVKATAQGGLWGRARSLCSSCRQVFGIPDYERYLAHAALWHPGAPVLSRRDFFAQALERKYGNGGARCC